MQHVTHLGVVCGNHGYMHVFLVCIYCKLLGGDVEWGRGRSVRLVSEEKGSGGT